MNFSRNNDLFKNCIIENDKIIVNEKLSDFITMVKNDFKFDMLTEIIAIDNQDNGIELIYNMYSTENDENVKISTFVNSTAESISKIFSSATADENEIYDLFGIEFIGNTNLKRLYMPESWNGHPLKKDYKETDERLQWND